MVKWVIVTIDAKAEVVVEAMALKSEQWREAQAAREFISALENQLINDKEPIGGRGPEEWLNWARERLLAHNPLCSGAEGVWKNLAEVTDWE